MRVKRPLLAMTTAVALAIGTGGAALAIVGGRLVRQAPSWVGSLQLSGGAHECGASLVSSTWAVTAKHCIDTHLVQARFGSLDYSAGGELVGVAGTVAGPKNSDIALVRLAEPVSGAPVTIATSSPSVGTQATLLGWGQMIPQKGAGPSSHLLQELSAHVVEDSTCNGTELSINGSTELCVQGSHAQTACYGDSGGPAVVDGKLVGATSRGTNTCGDGNTIYNDVTTFRSWIEQTIGATGSRTTPTQGTRPVPGAQPTAGPTSVSGSPGPDEWDPSRFGNGRSSARPAPSATQASPASTPRAATSLTPRGDGAATFGRVSRVNWGTEGECISYVLERFKKQTGAYPLGRDNAWNFANSTGVNGWTVGTAPRANSVIVFQPGQNGAGNRGHVAWVEQVSGNQIQIAEMNFEGRNKESRRTIVPAAGVMYVYAP